MNEKGSSMNQKWSLLISSSKQVLSFGKNLTTENTEKVFSANLCVSVAMLVHPLAGAGGDGFGLRAKRLWRTSASA